MIKFVRTFVPVVASALAATLASSAVDCSVTAVYPDIMGCEHGCFVVGGGWPVAYLVDYPGISPVGSVSLTDALLGVDRFRPASFALSLLFWLAVCLSLRAVGRRVSSRRRRRDTRQG